MLSANVIFSDILCTDFFLSLHCLVTKPINIYVLIVDLEALNEL
jgi:hypothetical protein